ncbi:MAG: hypothetical protein ABI416_16640, partial [Ginsengibacter sp.]
MKKLLLALTIITGFAACKNSSEPIESTGAVQLLPSVASYNNNISSDTSNGVFHEVTPSKIVTPPTKIVYIVREPAHTTVNSPTAPVNQVPAPVMTPVTPAFPGPGGIDTATVQPTPGGATAGTGVNPVIPQPVKKKGWNNAAKGD